MSQEGGKVIREQAGGAVGVAEVEEFGEIIAWQSQVIGELNVACRRAVLAVVTQARLLRELEKIVWFRTTPEQHAEIMDAFRECLVTPGPDGPSPVQAMAAAARRSTEDRS